MKDAILKQANTITEARYEMTALEKDIVYLLMRELKGDDPIGKEYVIDVNLLKKNTPELTQKELRKATHNLQTRTYQIKSEDSILTVSFMGVVCYDAPEEKLYIKISRYILPYLVALRKNYTEFQLGVVLSLKSKFAKRIYEMLSQYKEVGKFEISLEELKWRLAVTNPKTGKDTYPSYANFKSIVLTPSEKEINEKSDLMFTYEAYKTGNKYTHLTFHIKKRDRQLSAL